MTPTTQPCTLPSATSNGTIHTAPFVAQVSAEHGLDDDSLDSGELHAARLARAAFTLMDADGDGDLSMVEIIGAHATCTCPRPHAPHPTLHATRDMRHATCTCTYAGAFQRDERVRKLLRPLLPLPSAKQQSIYATGTDAIAQQVAAFESLFREMDTDSSGGVDRDEFEAFFQGRAVPTSHELHPTMGGPQQPSAEHQELTNTLSMWDFIAARNDARDKPPETRLTAGDMPLLMGNSDGERKVRSARLERPTYSGAPDEP